MSDVSLKIDGKDVTVPAGTTLLEAARKSGAVIPTLCQNDKLEPYGGCRICMVEMEAGAVKRMVAACTHPAEAGVAVTTKSDKIGRVRKTILELLLAHAPDSLPLQKLAKEYGARRDAFEKDPMFCIHCGLCVRYCNEVKKLDAVGFVDRGIRKEISFIPEVAAQHCNDCKECFPLCPTSYLQAAFVYVENLAFPHA